MHNAFEIIHVAKPVYLKSIASVFNGKYADIKELILEVIELRAENWLHTRKMLNVIDRLMQCIYAYYCRRESNKYYKDCRYIKCVDALVKLLGIKVDPKDRR